MCALVAFNKASERYEEEGSDESRQEEKQITLVLETEALIQIFGIIMFFIVSAVMVNGVVEVKTMAINSKKLIFSCRQITQKSSLLAPLHRSNCRHHCLLAVCLSIALLHSFCDTQSYAIYGRLHIL